MMRRVRFACCPGCRCTTWLLWLHIVLLGEVFLVAIVRACRMPNEQLLLRCAAAGAATGCQLTWPKR